MNRNAFSEWEKRILHALALAMLPGAHGLPGAATARAAEAIDGRIESWDRGVVAGVKWLLRSWELSPLASRYRRTFTKLDPAQQREWTDASYHSKRGWRRLQVTALKQLIFMEWASSPEVEDALGYDYRCRRDDEVHGSAREIEKAFASPATPPEPSDYQRPGPATASGAIPIHLTTRREFRAVEENATKLTTIGWPEVTDGHVEKVDVVVVGSGAGGAVAATYLAEAGVDVIVLEEGEHVTAADFNGPMFHRLQRFCRDNGTTQVWGDPPIPLPMGKVVGGTTVVNSGTCFRAPDRVLDRWVSEFGIEDGNQSELAEHYEPLEEFLNVRPVPWELLGPNGMAAHRGAVALGYSGGPLLRNIADCHGCGQCAFGCPTNAKQAMHISFLPRAQRAGARVFSRCRVDRIVVEGGVARGVVASLLSTNGRRRGTMRVFADHVVVAAGAVLTPALLARSDVADPSRQTGRNLRIHPATGVGGFFNENVDNWKGTLQSYYIDQFFESHELMFEATTTVPSIGAGSLPGVGKQAIKELSDFRRLATLGFYVSDTSRGRVFAVRNRVLPTYRMNELDCKRMTHGISLAAEVLLEAGATRVYPGIPGVDTIDARADLEQLRQRRVRPHHLKLTAFHPMGTARMGSDPERSVVDPFGHHHAVQRLWVADASTFPTCVGVNPQMTIMAFAKRTADRIAAKYS
jgi:choline dehydrogenase-like flavoprotein